MQLTNYLFFEDRTGEAFAFYAKCLGGKIIRKVTLGETPGASTRRPNADRLITHIRLQAGNAMLVGSDWRASATGDRYPGIHRNAVSLSVDTPGEAEQVFSALGDGGKVIMPIAETKWTRCFGMLTDRYGATWTVSCSKPS